MLNTLLAIDFNPGLRGIVVVLISVVVLIGGTYLVVGTNLGAAVGRAAAWLQQLSVDGPAFAKCGCTAGWC